MKKYLGFLIIAATFLGCSYFSYKQEANNKDIDSENTISSQRYSYWRWLRDKSDKSFRGIASVVKTTFESHKDLVNSVAQTIANDEAFMKSGSRNQAREVLKQLEIYHSYNRHIRQQKKDLVLHLANKKSYRKLSAAEISKIKSLSYLKKSDLNSAIEKMHYLQLKILANSGVSHFRPTKQNAKGIEYLDTIDDYFNALTSLYSLYAQVAHWQNAYHNEQNYFTRNKQEFNLGKEDYPDRNRLYQFSWSELDRLSPILNNRYALVRMNTIDMPARHLSLANDIHQGTLDLKINGKAALKKFTGNSRYQNIEKEFKNIQENLKNSNTQIASRVRELIDRGASHFLKEGVKEFTGYSFSLRNLIQVGLSSEDKYMLESLALAQPLSPKEYAKQVQFLAVRESLVNSWGVQRLTEPSRRERQEVKDCAHGALTFKVPSNKNILQSGYVDELWRMDMIKNVLPEVLMEIKESGLLSAMPIGSVIQQVDHRFTTDASQLIDLHNKRLENELLSIQKFRDEQGRPIDYLVPADYQNDDFYSYGDFFQEIYFESSDYGYTSLSEQEIKDNKIVKSQENIQQIATNEFYFQVYLDLLFHKDRPAVMDRYLKEVEGVDISRDVRDIYADIARTQIDSSNIVAIEEKSWIDGQDLIDRSILTYDDLSPESIALKIAHDAFMIRFLGALDGVYYSHFPQPENFPSWFKVSSQQNRIWNFLRSRLGRVQTVWIAQAASKIHKLLVEKLDAKKIAEQSLKNKVENIQNFVHKYQLVKANAVIEHFIPQFKKSKELDQPLEFDFGKLTVPEDMRLSVYDPSVLMELLQERLFSGGFNSGLGLSLLAKKEFADEVRSFFAKVTEKYTEKIKKHFSNLVKKIESQKLEPTEQRMQIAQLYKDGFDLVEQEKLLWQAFLEQAYGDFSRKYKYSDALLKAELNYRGTDHVHPFLGLVDSESLSRPICTNCSNDSFKILNKPDFNIINQAAYERYHSDKKEIAEKIIRFRNGEQARALATYLDPFLALSDDEKGELNKKFTDMYHHTSMKIDSRHRYLRSNTRQVMYEIFRYLGLSQKDLESKNFNKAPSFANNDSAQFFLANRVQNMALMAEPILNVKLNKEHTFFSNRYFIPVTIGSSMNIWSFKFGKERERSYTKELSVMDYISFYKGANHSPPDKETIAALISEATEKVQEGLFNQKHLRAFCEADVFSMSGNDLKTLFHKNEHLRESIIGTSENPAHLQSVDDTWWQRTGERFLGFTDYYWQKKIEPGLMWFFGIALAAVLFAFGAGWLTLAMLPAITSSISFIAIINLVFMPFTAYRINYHVFERIPHLKVQQKILNSQLLVGQEINLARRYDLESQERLDEAVKDNNLSILIESIAGVGLDLYGLGELGYFIARNTGFLRRKLAADLLRDQFTRGIKGAEKMKPLDTFIAQRGRIRGTWDWAKTYIDTQLKRLPKFQKIDQGVIDDLPKLAIFKRTFGLLNDAKLRRASAEFKNLPANASGSEFFAKFLESLNEVIELGITKIINNGKKLDNALIDLNKALTEFDSGILVSKNEIMDVLRRISEDHQVPIDYLFARSQYGKNFTQQLAKNKADALRSLREFAEKWNRYDDMAQELSRAGQITEDEVGNLFTGYFKPGKQNVNKKSQLISWLKLRDLNRDLATTLASKNPGVLSGSNLRITSQTQMDEIFHAWIEIANKSEVGKNIDDLFTSGTYRKIMKKLHGPNSVLYEISNDVRKANIIKEVMRSSGDPSGLRTKDFLRKIQEI